MEAMVHLLQELSAQADRRHRLGPGEVLIREGESGGTVYVLLTGKLIVSRLLDGRTTKIRTISQAGAIIGERAVLGEAVRTATVAAVEASELVALTPHEFESILARDVTVAAEFAERAARRAEEGELAELLAEHFGLAHDDALHTVIAEAEWRRLSNGDVLFKEGDSSDAVYFVIRGRLLATRSDPDGGVELRLGEVGQGEIVGEVGLLRSTARTATVTALRDTVLAGLSEENFLRLLLRRPRFAIAISLEILDRSENAFRRSAGSVLAVITSEDWNESEISAGLQSGLSPFGRVERLSASSVDAFLDSPGASESPPGSVGEVRTSRLLREAELETEHLILEVGKRGGHWAHRCLQSADRVLVFLPRSPQASELDRIVELLGRCPVGLSRFLVRVHPPGSQAPEQSSQAMDQIGASEIAHVIDGSKDDLARVARLAAGRANCLVLGGGGGRGFAHIGAWQALTELGFPIDLVGGSSMGGILGAVIADDWSVDRLVDWAVRHFPKALDYTIPTVSLVKGRRIERSASATFGMREIEDLWHTYFCVSTDLTASVPYLHRRGLLTRTLRATSAIPGLMPPVPLGDHLLVDGGVLNNLPIDVARELAPKGKVVAVDVAPPRGPSAHGDYGLSVSGWAALRSQWLRRGSDYPKISAVLMRSMIIGSMRERDRQLAAGMADCYLDLDMRGVSILEFGDPASVAKRGYEASMPVLTRWLEDSGQSPSAPRQPPSNSTGFSISSSG